MSGGVFGQSRSAVAWCPLRGESPEDQTWGMRVPTEKEGSSVGILGPLSHPRDETTPASVARLAARLRMRTLERFKPGDDESAGSPSFRTRVDSVEVRDRFNGDRGRIFFGLAPG